MENINCIELTENELCDVHGGSVLGGIALFGGVVCAINETYKFGKGVVEGWKNN
ncbi:hypothetical protein LGK97_17120 [Clostridium sp. CS001]|uniref:hypothetical protein n=1 Tax=Clostridium sp. CS001 TaxID=2880648 RepID=UPI001CF1EFD0|nr:hypothetical protein [Clostridium sp. CS001]MCB2291448.1 hypothetical protein [Clostridium sp. CS001]